MTRVGDVLWSPSEADLSDGPLGRYAAWLRKNGLVDARDYATLWNWSVQDVEQFWGSVWDYFDVGIQRGDEVLAERVMPGACWFPGAKLNYAQEVLRRAPRNAPAFVSIDESGHVTETSTADLIGQVGALARTLRSVGVQPGDRVAAFVSNIVESAVALLATAAVGAVWTACAPDFGTRAVVDRFRQVEPVVLVAVDGYEFGGRQHDRSEVLRELEDALPSLRRTILIPSGVALADEMADRGRMLWRHAVADPVEPDYVAVPFDHPLWVLYSSGTTGRPKGIVHGHGGIVLELLKAIVLGSGVDVGDRFYCYSSTSWMVWNVLVSVPLAGGTAILYNGSPTYPDVEASWRVAGRTRATMFGGGAAYLTSCERAGVRPAEHFRESTLRMVMSTGSPLPSSTWSWVYEQFGPRLRLDSSSGGTDVCSSFISGSPWLPVYVGEISAPNLGVKVESFDENGKPVVGEVGELVITEPMPSMPLYFWGDPDGSLYREAYFSMYPDVWRHGDFIEFTERGSVVVRGRSDATLNRGGVRIGSADLYAVVDLIPEVADSLVLGIELPDGGYYMPLFVVPEPGSQIQGLERTIRDEIAAKLSRRHVPDEIIVAPAVPRTLTGKKLEVPIKRLMQGTLRDGVVSVSAITNADALPWFEQFGKNRVHPLLQSRRPSTTGRGELPPSSTEG